MAGISALLVLWKSVSSKTTHFIIMESIADRDSSERRLSFFSVLKGSNLARTQSKHEAPVF